MQNYLQRLAESSLWGAFWLLIIIPLFLSLLYVIFSIGQNYNITIIVKEANQKMGISEYNIGAIARIKRKIVSFFKDREEENALSNMLTIALSRVNGWNFMTTAYSCLYYSFNFWSVAFAVFSIIVMNSDGEGTLDSVCTVFTAILLCSTLCLKLEHKWMIFKDVFSKAGEETNNFIYSLKTSDQPQSLIKEYSNKIIGLEKTLKENELL